MNRSVIALVVLAAGIYLLIRWQASDPIAARQPVAIGQPSREDVVPRNTRDAGSAAAPSKERAAQLALEIERALVAADPQQRETAFTYLLPELLGNDPECLV